MIGMFSAFLRIHVPFAIRLFDGIMLVNLILMLVVGNVVRVPSRIVCFILYLALSGAVGILHGTDTITLVAKEFLGISITLVYFYYFFRMIQNDFERAFTTYARIAFWFAVIALPLWAGECVYFQEYVRLRGLTAEPTSFCILVLPAYYWYTYQYFTSRSHGSKVAVFTLAIILTSSTNGYVSVIFGTMLLLSARLKYLIAIPVVVCAIIGLAYTYSGEFRLRVDDTLRAAVTQNVRGSNLSTYALMSNVFITRQVLKESPVIGNGLGSHPISHERFIADIPGIGMFIRSGWADLNAPEAASLALRSLSELGIVGFLGLLIFMFHFHVSGNGPRAAISNAILVVFFLKLIRDGLYFAPEQFFFMFVYILNYRQYKVEAQSVVRRIRWKVRWCAST